MNPLKLYTAYSYHNTQDLETIAQPEVLEQRNIRTLLEGTHLRRHEFPTPLPLRYTVFPFVDIAFFLVVKMSSVRRATRKAEIEGRELQQGETTVRLDYVILAWLEQQYSPFWDGWRSLRDNNVLAPMCKYLASIRGSAAFATLEPRKFDVLSILSSL